MTIYKTQDGYSDNRSDEYTHIMHYDHDGNYVAQTQDDMIDEGCIRIGAEIIDGVPCVNGKPVPPLSSEDMEVADRKTLHGYLAVPPDPPGDDQ